MNQEWHWRTSGTLKHIGRAHITAPAVDAWTKSAGKKRLDALLDAAFDAVSS
jgi:hypothetical protein